MIALRRTGQRYICGIDIVIIHQPPHQSHINHRGRLNTSETPLTSRTCGVPLKFEQGLRVGDCYNRLREVARVPQVLHLTTHPISVAVCINRYLRLDKEL